MRKNNTITLFLIIGAAVLMIAWFIPSPHGDDFKISCNVCHSSKGWYVDKEIYSFNHDKTKMPLFGQHIKADCKRCHPTLIFSEAKTDCISCHKDVHESSVGPDCNRCHSTNSWLVENITKIHQQSRFPLVGIHSTVDCYKCHKSETFLRFEAIGTDCYSCHSAIYSATTQPNHVSSGFSQRCDECHNIYSKEWKGEGFNHKFFPLTQGHAISSCETCHTNGNYSNLSKACVDCHQTDYNTASNPNHQSLNFPTTCNDCHSTQVGWKPAAYKQHDSQYFPIYSGAHNGRWANCTDCHSNTSNYTIFSCTDCHEHNKASMDSKHDGESGYSYTSSACLHCHPRGSSEK